MNNNSTEMYAQAWTKYAEAKKMLEISMPDHALFSVRKGLESIVKELCARCGIETRDTDGEIALNTLIDMLYSNGIITETGATGLHRIRILGNRGVHIGDQDQTPTMEQAAEAVELLSLALEKMTGKHDDALYKEKTQENNVPMRNPDYYSPSRRYYGMWWNCYSREALAVIPEYDRLKERADSGDISAMLDLAVGFLPRQITWSSTGLVCMPKYRTKDGREYFQDAAYDARYYYWILKAGYQTVQNVAEDKAVPMKYIATVLLEVVKAHLSLLDTVLATFVSGCVRTENGYSLVYQNQYEIARDMFGEDLMHLLDFERTVSCLSLLISLLNSTGTFDIISQVHKENTMDRIKYLGYCYWGFLQAQGTDTAQVEPIPEAILLSREDVGKPVTLELLQKYTTDPICKMHYVITEKVIRELSVREKNPLLFKFMTAISQPKPGHPAIKEMSETTRFKVATGLFGFIFVGDVLLGLAAGIMSGSFMGFFEGILAGTLRGLLSGFQIAGIPYGWQTYYGMPNWIGRSSMAIMTGWYHLLTKLIRTFKQMKTL